MPQFIERARTRTECMEKIRTLYGTDAKIMFEKTVRSGGFLGIGGRNEVELTGIYGFSHTQPSQVKQPAPPMDLETAKRQVLAIAKNMPQSSSSYQTLRKEISDLTGIVRSLTEKIDTRAGGAQALQGAEHPSLQRLEEDLLLNEFTPSFVRNILERVRREFSLNELDNYEELQKQVIHWIGEKISIYQEPEPAIQGKKKPRIIVLVGPTGVGKTTTTVKLAALYGELARSEGVWQKQVRLVNLDCYRIGAEYQIQKYGEIMEVPVTLVENYDGMKQMLALYRQDVDFILIDTIGLSPRNYGEFEKMKAILDACPSRTEIHLCISASFKPGDVREILKQFEPFKYKSVIITKLDETGRIGNIISVLAEERKSASFITTGQSVPWDIERASVARFLVNLEEFTVDKLYLMDHFSSQAAGTGV